MNNRELISQYVDTGLGLPRYQYDKLSKENKITYLRKMKIAISYNVRNIEYYYGELDKETQLEAVKQDGNAIKYINNPSETVQLEAVKQYGYAIQYINKPSETVQLAAVKQTGSAIQYINNPSEMVKLAAKGLSQNK